MYGCIIEQNWNKIDGILICFVMFFVVEVGIVYWEVELGFDGMFLIFYM